MMMTFCLRYFLIRISFTIAVIRTYSCSLNSTCGCSVNPVSLTKIIGGEDAEIDTWSWAVSIRVKNRHVCGGSLISSELVLTAAHCFLSTPTASSLSVTAGSKYLSHIKQERSVSQIATHRYYDVKTFANDIAVIRLSSPFDMHDSSLAVICLLPSTLSSKMEYPPKNAAAVAIGWGIVSTQNKIVSNILQQVTLKTIADDTHSCQQAIQNNRIQFCAGVQDGGKDTCQGDSGGPLMMFSAERWYLVGITSYGIGCALPGYPGVYTRVSAYGEWISCFLNNNTLCIRDFAIVKSSGSLFFASCHIISCLIFFTCTITYSNLK